LFVKAPGFEKIRNKLGLSFQISEFFLVKSDLAESRRVQASRNFQHSGTESTGLQKTFQAMAGFRIA
jgi:hypothetical protein